MTFRIRINRPLVLVLLLLLSEAGSALNIDWNFDYDLNNFFADGSNARLSLEAAGDWFENNIHDSLLPITSNGLNSYDARFRHPSQLNGSGTDLTFETLNDINIAADTVMIVVGAVDLGQPFGSSTLAVAQPGFTSIPFQASQQYKDDSYSRGQGLSGIKDDVINAPNQQTANDFAMWGGIMSFDYDRNWHDDPYSLPTSGTADLFSVALHELAHVFGIGTSDVWDNQLVGNSFAGLHASTLFGGNVPTTSDGAHWANSGVGTSPIAAGFEAYGVTTGDFQETAFDPSIGLGKRKVLTELDVAGLKDVGWEVAPPANEAVPVPVPPIFLFMLALGMSVVTLSRAKFPR